MEASVSSLVAAYLLLSILAVITAYIVYKKRVQVCIREKKRV